MAGERTVAVDPSIFLKQHIGSLLAPGTTFTQLLSTAGRFRECRPAPLNYLFQIYGNTHNKYFSYTTISFTTDKHKTWQLMITNQEESAVPAELDIIYTGDCGSRISDQLVVIMKGSRQMSVDVRTGNIVITHPCNPWVSVNTNLRLLNYAGAQDQLQ